MKLAEPPMTICLLVLFIVINSGGSLKFVDCSCELITMSLS